jgi:hypothetical protein
VENVTIHFCLQTLLKKAKRLFDTSGQAFEELTMKKFVCAFAVALLGFQSNSEAQNNLTNGLNAFFPFSGNANDSTGNGHNAAVNNASLATDRFGNANQAYSFNGSSSWLQTTNYWPVLGTNEVSVSCWINYQGGTPQPYAESTMVSWGGDSVTFGSRIEFRLTDGGNGNIAMCIDGGGNASVAKCSIQPNQWTHLTFTKPINGGLNNCSFYVNGRLVPTTQQSDNAYTFNIVQQNTFCIGRGQLNSGIRFFNGLIDDVRIYNRALNTNEVAQIYAAEAPTYLNIKKAIYLDSFTLKLGTNYQLQASSDLNTWTNVGDSFTATNYYWVTTNYWNVDNWNQLYFRLKTLP